MAVEFFQISLNESAELKLFLVAVEVLGDLVEDGLERSDDLRDAGLEADPREEFELGGGVAFVPEMAEALLGVEEGLLLPLVGEFEELPVLVLVELEGEVEAADDRLGVGEVLADVGVDQVVPLEQGHRVEHYLLVLERELVLPLALAHEFDELLQVPLRE